MRVVLQRVSRAGVSIEGSKTVSIGRGLLLLVGIGPEDRPEEIDAAVDRISGLRIFSDEGGKMNLSISDVAGEILVVSQFTLYGDLARGRRPSFSGAAAPEQAAPLIDRLVEGFRRAGLGVSSGEFGAKMSVGLVNDGPVTFSMEFRDGALVDSGHP
jgi:D-tyrosyl-tRNA(Tyr) deacylase